MRVAMRVTHIHEGSVEVVDSLEFAAVAETGGQPNDSVSVASADFADSARAVFVRIAAGGHMAMHTGAESGFVQVVHGRGTLELPGGVRIAFAGPELFLFRPNTLHSWTDIEEDTLMSSCIVG
jgi:quercetin dioxygenase-like cupin family protein